MRPHTHVSLVNIPADRCSLSADFRGYQSSTSQGSAIKGLLHVLKLLPPSHVASSPAFPGRRRISQREAEEERRMLTILTRWLIFPPLSWSLLKACSMHLRDSVLPAAVMGGGSHGNGRVNKGLGQRSQSVLQSHGRGQGEGAAGFRRPHPG